MQFSDFVHIPVKVRATDVITTYDGLLADLDGLGIPARAITTGMADAPQVEVFNSTSRKWEPVELNSRVVETAKGALPVPDASFAQSFTPAPAEAAAA
jgi:hypothetical protein